MRYAISGVFLLMLVLQSYSQSWQLVWSDEFSVDGAPDRAKWDYEVGYVRNNEAQYYTQDRRENARVENGSLVIESRRDNWDGHEYTSASLVTLGKGSWTYGRIEIRAQLPGGRGTWPALWTLGTNIGEVGWPACGEVDILENVGFDPSRVYGNIHVEAYNHAAGTGKGHNIVVTEPWRRYYTYTLEWHPDRMDFYVDDNLHWTFLNEGTGWQVWPFDKPQYLLMNVAIGGSWGGQQGIDTTIFPTKMLVDYVRIYQLSSPPPYVLSAQVSGMGSVTTTPQRENYDSAAVVSLTATPQEGYDFLGWQGDTTCPDNPLEISMVRDRLLVARFARPGEILLNGTFDRGMEHWSTWVNNLSTAAASYSVVNGVLQVTISQAGTNDWDVHLNQPGFSLVQGKQYVLSFDAWAGAPHTLGVGAKHAANPYTTHFYESVNLGTTVQHVELTFTMNNATDPTSRIEFNLGANSGTVYIDNVSLIPADAVALSKAPVPAGNKHTIGKAVLFDLRGRKHAPRALVTGMPVAAQGVVFVRGSRVRLGVLARFAR